MDTEKKYSSQEETNESVGDVYSPSSAYESGNPDFDNASKDPRAQSLG